MGLDQSTPLIHFFNTCTALFSSAFTRSPLHCANRSRCPVSHSWLHPAAILPTVRSPCGHLCASRIVCSLPVSLPSTSAGWVLFLSVFFFFLFSQSLYNPWFTIWHFTGYLQCRTQVRVRYMLTVDCMVISLLLSLISSQLFWQRVDDIVEKAWNAGSVYMIL